MGCRARIGLAVLVLVLAGSTPAAAGNAAYLERSRFHFLDYLALVVYLCVLVWIGLHFARREKTTADFFLAGRRIPWWAATLSIFSTHLSAVTFMAIPATAFAGDWVTILVNLGIILARLNDKIVPWFIVTQLPIGLSGLVIAGLFAATMSSVDSGMHSIATILVHDVYAKIRPAADDASRLRMARILTVVFGILGTLSAVLVSRIDASSLWLLTLLLVGLFGSSLTGVFVLGVFTRSANATGTAIGVAASIATLLVIRTMDPPPV